MAHQEFPTDAVAATAKVNPSVFSQGVPQRIESVHIDARSLAEGYRLSKVVGLTVVNGAGETVGKIEDFIVDSDREVPYAVLSVGGFMGIGKGKVFLPYSLLEVDDSNVTQMLFRTATKVALENLPDLAPTNGNRISAIIGATVVNSADETVGTVDDLMITPAQSEHFDVLSVGGFLGMGKKRVVVPCCALEVRDAKMVFALATKESLKSLPEFNYCDA